MAEAVITTEYRQRLAKHMCDGSDLPKLGYIVFGDGGHNDDLSAKAMNAGRTSLYHERVRKSLIDSHQEDAQSVTVLGRLEPEDLVGSMISEVGVLDTAGYLVGYRTFAPKAKDTDETYEAQIKIRF